MEIIILNAAGAVQFVRSDMEQGNWTEEEYTVNATFPYDPAKTLERGQRLAFKDPATGRMEVFEIRNVTELEPDHYQQIIAESIAVSELSDEHIDTTEITDQTPAQALTTVLTGTLWSVGNVSASDTSSVDIARGSVWQAVNSIAENFNCRISPRYAFNASGSITARYLDITSTDGVWRGVRLSVDKNLSDASIVYDDSEVLTALYGYGGTVDKPHTGEDDTTETLTFSDVVWSHTSTHPAKPAGQTYLEDPEKTALYGRNGRPRFGYYQNGNIGDAETLLEKTWEALKATSEPRISISGTVTDLKRLGMDDKPIRLHDMAIVDIPETGKRFYLQIIKLDLDLIDPSASRVEIGSYIPNIIYINRETAESGGGGGGGGRGQDNPEFEEATTYSALEKTNSMIGMVVGTRNGNNYIKAGEICLSINAQTGETSVLIQADKITLAGQATVEELLTGLAEIQNLWVSNLDAYTASFTGDVQVEGDTRLLDTTVDNLTASAVTTQALTVGSGGSAYAASWQSISHRHVSLSSQVYLLRSNSATSTTPYAAVQGYVVKSYNDRMIYYLGRAAT